MILRDVISALKAADQSAVLKNGFGSPHSYRGYYECLAFEPKENVAVAEMLRDAQEALGNTYEGYKGGEYHMYETTDCYLAFYGDCGEELGQHLLMYMLADRVIP